MPTLQNRWYMNGKIVIRYHSFLAWLLVSLIWSVCRKAITHTHDEKASFRWSKYPSICNGTLAIFSFKCMYHVFWSWCFHGSPSGFIEKLPLIALAWVLRPYLHYQQSGKFKNDLWIPRLVNNKNHSQWFRSKFAIRFHLWSVWPNWKVTPQSLELWSSIFFWNCWKMIEPPR